MATYVIKDVEDAHFFANMFGMRVTRQRGRFPKDQLRVLLESYGHQLDDSEYVPSSALPKKDPVYRIVAPIRLKNGRGRPKNGDVVRIGRGVIELPLSEIRALTGKTGRGRVGEPAAIEAAIKRAGWDISDRRSVVVEPV